MTSHREAPGISSDPAADNTDVYAFVSPDKPSTVTLISNFIPLQGAAAGPNFYRFDPNVLYEIMIDNDGDGIEDVTYQFSFQTNVANGATFLYNVGPISYNSSTNSFTNLNVQQTYTVTKVLGPRRTSSRPARYDHRHRAPGPAARHRTPLDAQLRHGDLPEHGLHAQDGRDGLRRPKGGRILRRPRLDLRPRDAEAVRQRPAHTRLLPSTTGVDGTCWIQRPLDSHPGPDHGADQHRKAAQRGQPTRPPR